MASVTERMCECENEKRGLYVYRGNPDWWSCEQCDGRVRLITDKEGALRVAKHEEKALFAQAARYEAALQALIDADA